MASSSDSEGEEQPGGSAAEAEPLVGELVVREKVSRKMVEYTCHSYIRPHSLSFNEGAARRALRIAVSNYLF